MTADYEAWRCPSRDLFPDGPSVFCPAEGCSVSEGCVRDRGETLAELGVRLNVVLDRYDRAREAAVRDGKRTQPTRDAAVAYLIEIITLGNVPEDTDAR